MSKNIDESPVIIAKSEPPSSHHDSSTNIDEAPKHGQFSSRWAYWFTAIACAVGFGNVWRFPYLCFQYGGLAFNLPYLFGLIVVVWPVFTLEMGLGQMTENGNLGAFSRLGYRCRGFGMTGFTSFNICCYYPLLLVWTAIYFVNSFRNPMPWSISDDEKAFCGGFSNPSDCLFQDICEWNPNQEICVVDMLARSRAFFRENCFAFDDIHYGEHHLGLIGISGANVLAMFVVWFLNYLTLFAGPKILGYIMYVSMSLPTVFFIVLIIVGATLPGASLGIKQFTARLDLSDIAGTDAWMSAIGQGVFSVGVAQGTAVAYSAHNPKKQCFPQDSVVVIVADCIYSFLAGFTVFAAIGYLAHALGTEVRELPIEGISLAFVTYPLGMSMIQYPGGNIFCVLFFLTLWLIGTNTLAGLTEAVILIFADSRIGIKWGVKRWQVVLAVCTFFFVLPGLLFCTNLGYFLLDSLDTYSSSVAQAFGAGAEALCVGWIFLADKVIARIGKAAYITHFATWYIGTALLGILYATTNATIAFPIGLVLMFGGMATAFFLCKKTGMTGREYSLVDKLYYMTIFQVEPLRKLFNDNSCQETKIWKLGPVWMVLLKYAAPTTVMFLFFTSICDPNIMYRRPAGDLDIRPYPWYVFLVGQLGPFGLVVLGTIFFTIFPQWITPLLPPGDDDRPILGVENVPLTDRLGHGEVVLSDLPTQDVSTVSDASSKQIL